MISGFSADTPVATIRASGLAPTAAALASDITTTAAAPSFSGQQLPAVTVPSGRNTGLSWETPSMVVPSRMPSSWRTSMLPSSGNGVISRSKKPRLRAASARFWDSTPHSSWAWRDTPLNWATFSAVWPMAM